jgi:epoxyqueuosine reductase QueG
MDAGLNGHREEMNSGSASGHITAEELRAVCREEGADDSGFVEVGRQALAAERNDMLRVFPEVKTVISIVKRANREGIRSASLAVADQEFSKTYSSVSDIACGIIGRLNRSGVRGVAVPAGFPMDMTRWPGKVWELSHKLVAIEAGMGHMGQHRVVIHPGFGNHIALGTIIVDTEVDRYDRPQTESPCIECGLCIAVCPVGALSRESGLDFMSCAMHNYHELFGGFQEWIEEIVSSGNIRSYRSKFRDSETGSKWQSLTYGHAYRCSYCMAVCPAGGETAKTYLSDKKSYMARYVKPLKSKKEPVYVIAGTKAEKVAKKNQCKEVRYVRNTIRPASVQSFLDGAGLLFNPEKAEGVNVTLHFEFTGKENRSATIAISEGRLNVMEGHSGKADLRIRSDSETWGRIVNEEISPVMPLITGKLRLKGNPSHLKKFKSCIL